MSERPVIALSGWLTGAVWLLVLALWPERPPGLVAAFVRVPEAV